MLGPNGAVALHYEFRLSQSGWYEWRFSFLVRNAYIINDFDCLFVCFFRLGFPIVRASQCRTKNDDLLFYFYFEYLKIFYKDIHNDAFLLQYRHSLMTVI